MEVINDYIVSDARVICERHCFWVNGSLDILVHAISVLEHTKFIQKARQEKQVVVGVAAIQVLESANSMNHFHEEESSCKHQSVDKHLEEALGITSL